jgi:hypothetical protein
MEANFILKGFCEITRTDLPTDRWFFHYEVFSKNWKPAKTIIIIIRWIMMQQRHQILGLRQFLSGQHQAGITRHILVGQWGSQGKKKQ